MESYSRIRSVKLKRPNADVPFGFSVRGGHEHGTGIFVSSIEPRSMAHKARLKVGDQILRLNGFPVSAAVHNECLSLMRFRTSLHLKVRSVGMIPVKEKQGDPLTWKLVEEPPLPPVEESFMSKSHIGGGGRHHGRPEHFSHSRHSGSDSSSHFDSRLCDSHGSESKVFIDTTGQSGLGCCICKGPPERAGIFVQSTKSNGVAREAGLRPGDQILQCNGHSFLNIPFAEAVFHLKISKHLNLVVVKGAASDLFPGESSGYNSSASSLNGDTHISASSVSSSSNNPIEINGDMDGLDHYRSGRLPLVSEERRPSSKGSSNSDPDGHGIVLDRHIEWNEVEESWKEAEKEKLVIQIRGEEETGKTSMISSVRIVERESSGSDVDEKRLLEERKKLLEDQRRLLEEAVKFEEEKRQFEEEKRQLVLMKNNKQPPPAPISKLSPALGSPEIAPTPLQTHNSLAGALHKEILKRVERRENGSDSKHGGKSEDEKPKPGTVDQKICLFANNADMEKRQQHEQLIKEFKRAHRKMFAHSLEQLEVVGEEKDKDGMKLFGAKRIQKEVEHERKMVAQQVAGIVRQRQLRIERQHQESQETEREVIAKHVFRSSKSPPPPPPLPPGSGGPPVVETSATKTTNKPVKVEVNKGPKSLEPVYSGKRATSPAVTIRKEEVDFPESPSPDYSNSPSPTPITGDQWEERVSANGKIYSRTGVTKFDFSSSRPHQPKENKDLHPNGITQKYQNDLSHRNNTNMMPSPQRTNIVKNKDDEITTSGNGKVTIILGDPNQIYNGSNNNHHHTPSKTTKSNGGILKMANGNYNVNDHSLGGGLPQKTISFGEF